MNNETIAELGFEAGADSVGFFTLKKFAELVAAHERNTLAAWMIQFGFATGHGDTMEQLVDALGTEIVDRIEFEIDAAVLKERERIMAANAPELERANAHIKALEEELASLRARGN
jgi:hypothetical protein